MKITGNLLLIFLAFFTSISAQKPEDWLAKWGQQHPIEKVHLHFDRESYIAGETIWFKAYLSSDYLPDTVSSSLYVELVNTTLSVVDQKVLPVFLGSTTGQLDLPDSLSSGMYTIRAFTPSMVKAYPDFIFKKGIYIYGKKQKEQNSEGTRMIKMEFFPEGGNLVAGLMNTVAFKASGEEGLPVSVKGIIRNSKGEEITTFSDYHDGLGMFEITPVSGEKYFAYTGMEKFVLPEPAEKGVVLTIIPHPQGSFFELQQKTNDTAFMPSYMIGQMQHRVVFRQDFNMAKESLQGVINTQHLHSGILQITVFSKNGMPLAERLCFVDNKEYLLPAELIADTVDLSIRGRNRFRISLKDTVQGSISVSVTDADYETQPVREENILTSLLLTSDIRGYVHHPAYYFSAGNDSVKTSVDLVMMTNGWRRFKWTELAEEKKTPHIISSYITLAGRATLRSTNRPFADKSMLLMINSMNGKKSRSTHMLQTNKDGHFLIDSLVFFDRNRLLFSDVRGKKSQYIDVLLQDDSLHKNFLWPDFIPAPGKASSLAANSKWQMDYNEILKANGLLLEGITVKVQKKNPLQQIDERYTTGMFSGEATKAIDLVNTDEALPYNNIFDYLQNRVNGLQITTDGAEYGVFYRQGPSISSMGNIPMTLFLDEIETDVSVIATIPANQVALVKMYNTFAGAWGNAPGGVLAIYTKKGQDYNNAGYANVSFYNGYSVVKEFYAPDYKAKKANDKADNRITLDWRPNIFINNVDPKIPVSFYNNDRTRKFKVVVEGMTTSGKLIWLEKIISSR